MKSAEEDSIMIFTFSSLIVKSLSWAHTVAQKLKRFEKHDKSDVTSILKYLEEHNGAQWNKDPKKVIEWLREKLPAYADELRDSEQRYTLLLKMVVFRD